MLAPMLSGLTEAQREAVTHLEGPLLILAGPGSGKTRVVTHRVAWLLQQGIPGHQILALTFTNKAADEMSRRIERLADDPSVWVGTFHRFCARLLRKYAPLVGLQENYTIYDAGDSIQALRQAVGRLKIDVDRFPPETIAKAISWAKNNLILPDQYQPRPGHALGNVVREVYPAYQSPVGHLERRRFRRSAAARGHHPPRQSRGPRRASTSDTASSWSTSTRTPTWPNMPSPGPCRSIIPTWRPPATPTNRSMAGGARI